MSEYVRSADLKPQPGDLFAVSGRGLVSWLIRWWTGSPISHIAVVGRVDSVVEATSLNGRIGVWERSLRSFLERAARRGDRVMWLRLHRRHIEDIDARVRMVTYLYRQVGKLYDFRQAIRSGIGLFRSVESDAKFFCSELAARCHEAGGVYECNASEVKPVDICRFAIYEPEYIPVVGSAVEIDGFNSREPDGFGEGGIRVR